MEISILFACVYTDLNIAGVCGDFTSAAGCGLGNIDFAGVGFRNEHFICEQIAGNIAGVGFHRDLPGITTFKFHIAGCPFNIEFFGGDHILEYEITGITVGKEILTPKV